MNGSAPRPYGRVVLVAGEPPSPELRRELEFRGLGLEPAGSAESAVQLVAERNGSVAGLLLSCELSGEPWRAGLAQIGTQNPGLPLVLTSEGTQSQEILRALCPAALVAAGRSVPSPGPAQMGDLREPGSHAVPWVCLDPKMRALQSALVRIAASEAPVILRGESGVGKGIIARELHRLSGRREKPFQKINCAAFPIDLLESELFGYERGAFTGAQRRTEGKLEAARGGTLLLDEIGDMDYRLQGKLLHVLQDGEFQRLGGHELVRTDLRVLAATHCDLEEAIRCQRFRADLYYRLNVISLQIPPLRERPDDILALASHFLQKHRAPLAPPVALTAGLAQAMLRYPWPGNVRELENVVRRLVVLGDSSGIARELSTTSVADRDRRAEVSPDAAASSLCGIDDRRDRERTKAIVDALDATRWNRKKAAARLGVEYKTLLYRMKKLGVA